MAADSAMTPDPLPPQQLLMRISAHTVHVMSPVPLPRGYHLRGFLPGDEEAWIRVLDKAGFDGWTTEKFQAYMEPPERRQGSRCIECCGRLVAGVFASRRQADPPQGELDYVAADPEHSGRGLGRAVCAAVLRYLVERGYPQIFLSTDDWRLPALHVYLSLGFRPVMTRVDMPERWSRIYERLGFAQGLSSPGDPA